MLLAEFDEHFSKLKNKWPRFYTAEMESDVFLVLEQIEPIRFARFVKNLLWRKVGDPPGMEVFETFVRLQSKNQENAEVSTADLRKHCKCSVCFDSGVVHTRDLEPPLFNDGLGESMFFRCRCREGKGLGKPNITEWDQSWNVRYRIYPNADPVSRAKHHIKYMTIDGLHPYPHMKPGFKSLLEGA